MMNQASFLKTCWSRFWLAGAIALMLVTGEGVALSTAPVAQAAPRTTTTATKTASVPDCGTYEYLHVTLTGKRTYYTACDGSGNAFLQGTCTSGFYSYYDAPFLCVYVNANYSGEKIVFTGAGCANLTDFLQANGKSWNDTISSFASFGNPNGGAPAQGALWWDINDSGYYYLYGPSPRVTQTTYIGNTWNDQASSVEMDDSSGHAPAGC